MSNTDKSKSVKARAVVGKMFEHHIKTTLIPALEEHNRQLLGALDKHLFEEFAPALVLGLQSKFGKTALNESLTSSLEKKVTKFLYEQAGEEFIDETIELLDKEGNFAETDINEDEEGDDDKKSDDLNEDEESDDKTKAELLEEEKEEKEELLESLRKQERSLVRNGKMLKESVDIADEDKELSEDEKESVKEEIALNESKNRMSLHKVRAAIKLNEDVLAEIVDELTELGAMAEQDANAPLNEDEEGDDDKKSDDLNENEETDKDEELNEEESEEDKDALNEDFDLDDLDILDENEEETEEEIDLGEDEEKEEDDKILNEAKKQAASNKKRHKLLIESINDAITRGKVANAKK